MKQSECVNVLFEIIEFIPPVPEEDADAGGAGGGVPNPAEPDTSIQITIEASKVIKLQEFEVTPEQIIQAHGIWLDSYIQAFVEDPANSGLSEQIIKKLASAGITKISDIVDLSKHDHAVTWALFSNEEKISLVQTWASYFNEDTIPIEKISNDEFRELID